METETECTTWAGRAWRHVAAVSAGAPAEPSWRVTLNFHPDRTTPAAPGTTVLEALAEDVVYRSQFVTGTGNGGLTAYPGGDRWTWESRIFGGVYDKAPAEARPVYGALNHRRRPFGGAPRFGSAHLRLRAGVLARSTFCYPDSCTSPSRFAVAGTVGSLVRIADGDDQDALDDYVEAQVHGPVRLDRDVAAVVLDPCYRSTAVEDAARRLPCALEWHAGFRLTVGELRALSGYRGPEIVASGASIAVAGRLDPGVLGEAAASGRYDPQVVKRVWHCLARFGYRGTGPVR